MACQGHSYLSWGYTGEVSSQIRDTWCLLLKLGYTSES